jgi:hypothetical protein
LYFFNKKGGKPLDEEGQERVSSKDLKKDNPEGLLFSDIW